MTETAGAGEPRRATDAELSDELICVLVDLLETEQEMVGEMLHKGASPWQIVEAWHLVNNCTPLVGLQERLADAIGRSE